MKTVFNGTATGAVALTANEAVSAGLVALNGGIGVLEKPRVYAEATKIAEKVREYSSEVIANAHITLRELKKKIAPTGSNKLPSFKQLTAMNSPVVAVKEVQGATLTVYENGFATYEENGNHTVIAVDRCGGYRFDFTDGFDYIEADVFEDAEWAVRLVMEGENRLAHSRQVSRENFEDAFIGDESDNAFSVMVDFMEEENRALLADKEIKKLYAAMEKLTERQMQVIQLYYFKGMTMQEIGDELGMTKVAVHYSIEGALKKLKKSF